VRWIMDCPPEVVLSLRVHLYTVKESVVRAERQQTPTGTARQIHQKCCCVLSKSGISERL